MTHLLLQSATFANEPSSLYISRGADQPFFDAAMASGLGPQSRLSLTFGMFFADLDLDNRLDLVCSNGHLGKRSIKCNLRKSMHKLRSTTGMQVPLAAVNWCCYAPRRLAKRSEEDRRRAAAYGDLDDDGDLDIVLVSNGGLLAYFEMTSSLRTTGYGSNLKVTGKSNRDAAGAFVQLKAGGVTQRRFVTAARSYLSQCELALTFGLGTPRPWTS